MGGPELLGVVKHSRRARPTIEAMMPVLRAITEHTEDLECRLSRVVERVIAAQIAFIEGAPSGRL